MSGLGKKIRVANGKKSKEHLMEPGFMLDLESLRPNTLQFRKIP